MTRQSSSMTDPAILWPAIGNAFKKLDPRVMARNPVMFVVEVTATLTTFLFLRDLFHGQHHLGFAFQINLWLWFTVLFANFAEAVAEGRGKAQADSSAPHPLRHRRQGAGRPGGQDLFPTSRRSFWKRATWCWSSRATSSRPTAKWSKA